ncbi:hypothetical protein GCM10029992_37600 [Glycomyces albus]
MGTQLHYAVGRALRRSAVELRKADAWAVVGIQRRNGKVIARRLRAVSEALTAASGEAVDAEALPAIADRLRQGHLVESGSGLSAVAFIGQTHGGDQPRIGTAVLTDGAIAHLTWENDAPMPLWTLFPNGTAAIDAWSAGLAMILATLYAPQPNRKGGAV